MGIADNFRKGMGVVGDIYDLRMKRDKSAAYPEELDLANKMAAAKLLYQNYENQFAPEKMGLENQYLSANVTGKNIENKYLPEKLQGENKYRGLVNEWYAPNMKSEINARDTQTKFTPLKYAIEAENATRGNSRYDDAQKFMRSLGEMPAAQRTIWFSDPNNYDYYLKMQEVFKSGIGDKKQNGGNILTPQFLQKFGLEGGAQQQVPQQGMAAPIQSPPSGGMQPSAPAQQGIGQPMGMPQEMAPPQQGQVNIPGVGPVNAPPPQGQVTPQVEQVIPPESQVAPNANPVELTPQQKTQLGFQSVANQKVAGSTMTNRGVMAVGLANFIQQNKDVFAPRIENASKYAGVIGKGQKEIDRLKKETPEAYRDYLWVTKDFIPNLSNNIRMMEKLANTNEQTTLLNDMNSSYLRWDIDPKTSIKYLNMGMDMFERQSKAILDAAQPLYKGVLEQLNGIKTGGEQGDYVGSQQVKSIGGKSYKLVNGDWYPQ